MGTIRTGITAAAVNKYLRGGGTLYKDFTDVDNPGTALGETKGGSSFSYGLTFHDVEPDGAMGLIVGHRMIDKIVPTLAVSLLEHSVNHYLWTLPGGDSSNSTPASVNGEYIGTGLELDDGVVLGGSALVEESTLEIWETVTGGGVATESTLDTDYTVIDKIEFASCTVDETIKITGSDGVVYTYTAKAAEDLTAREFDYDSSDDDTAISFAACINSATYGVPGVAGTVGTGTSSDMVFLTRAVSGTPNTIAVTAALETIVTYQEILRTAGGVIADTDNVTAFYTYDTGATDTYTIITPGQIAAADHFTNIALMCEVSDASQTYPVVFIIKNPLSEPDTIEIPGERINETLLKTTWTGFFDPADGLDLDEAPVELWVPYGI